MSLEAKLFRAQPQVIYNGEVPQRNKDRILVVYHAPVVDYFYSASLWARMNEAIDNTLDRSDYQVLVLTPHRDDVTTLFFKNLSKSPLGPHPIASTDRKSVV